MCVDVITSNSESNCKRYQARSKAKTTEGAQQNG